MQYDAKEIADAMDLNPATIRAWANQFEIPTGKHGKKVAFNEEAKSLLEVIKNMKDQGSGMQTIKRRIATALPKDANTIQDNAPALDMPEISNVAEIFKTKLDSFKDEFTHTIEAGLDEKILKNNQTLIEQFGRTLTENNDLAEKFGKVAQINGRLEAEVAFLKQQLEEAKNEVKLLPSVLEHEKLEVRLEYQAKELEREALEKNKALALAEEVKKEAEALKAQLAAEQTLTWWDKLMGKKPKPPE